MSLPSPEPNSSTVLPNPGSVSPPSYTPAPLDDKISAPPVSHTRSDDKIAIDDRKIDDCNLPEVVPESLHENPQASPMQQKSEYGIPPPSTVSPPPASTLNYHGEGAQSPPILQHPAYQQQQQQQGQMGYTGHESMVMQSQSPAPAGPVYPPGMETVTPLHLLADQADAVDCPFCQRRAETKVKKQASGATHGIAAALLFTTLFGVIFPYTCHCASHVSHFCKNCGRKVAFKQHGGEMEPLGTPEHLREVSRYPAAEVPQKKK
ncbi:hypothetical protein FZEAL_1621 [Fusarium zealandicum]|uniref:LITAF domain-containing protein n=1 Tax=Fusarium zealandicum TaxID=1053134 RepID=A0A8H4UT11_9HYPO|nr:hypothetical protein FZEAL_1621 [Fusarium zealandicum]